MNNTSLHGLNCQLQQISKFGCIKREVLVNYLVDQCRIAPSLVGEMVEYLDIDSSDNLIIINELVDYLQQIELYN